VLWAAPLGLAGYLAGGALAPLTTNVRRYEEAAALFLVVGAAALLGGRHVRWIVRWRDLRWSDLHGLAPFVVGLLGVLNVLSAIWPREPAVMHEVLRWLPLEVTQRSRALMLMAGLALLQITRSLGRRKALAWWVATGALAVSLVTHVGRAFDVHHALVALALLAYLVAFRGRFMARSDPASLRQAAVMAPVLAASVWVFGLVGLTDLRARYVWDPGNTPARESVRSGLLIADPGVEPTTPLAARFLGALQIAGWAARFYLLVLLLRPVVLRARVPAPEDAVARAVREHGSHSLAALAAQEDKHHLVVAGGRGVVAYAVRRHVAFAAGDPLCADADLEAGAREWLEHCRRNGWTPCVYEAAEERIPLYRTLGLRSLRMAEEAIVDLRSFGLAGGERAALRSMVHKAARLGLAVRRDDRAAGPEPAIDAQLAAISDEWLRGKRVGEMGFSLGRFALDALDRVFVYLCLQGERVVAFTSWRSYRGGRAALLDLMRRRADAPSGAMDLLVVRALEDLRASGLEEASLANAPLAGLQPPEGVVARALAALAPRLRRLYGYESLLRFKKKFGPRWEGRYLVYPHESALPRIAYALTGVHASDGLRRLAHRR
jgi:phosphatidylglycerol lysyltransferase